METRHLIVSGSVQGIGYRWNMVEKARRLGVSGWVRNRSDGTVEAVAAGDAEAVAAIIAWARCGPPGAQVTHLAVEIGEGSFAGFEARPTV